ncbi:hypothetical protein TWF694_011378 [Orbilia ellipsospora]|uniref:Uncharacterized protein n=1 Tax=Orbilia ellipsospora TaxID=2528407 RepID=A0AAV9X5A9_9PEZI
MAHSFILLFLLGISLAIRPAISAPIPILVGNNVQLIGIAAQNLNNNIGNQQATASHSQGVQNNAQQNNSDQSTTEIIKDVDVLNNLTAVV